MLEVTRAAICGTDAAEWDHGPVLCRPGVVLGHEFVGRVVRLGDDVADHAHRRPRGLGCGNLVRSLSVVPQPSNEPVRRVPHARPSGRRRARRVRDVAGGDLPPGSRRVRGRRRGDDAAARRRAPRALAESLRRPGDAVAVIGAGGIGSFIVAGAARRAVAVAWSRSTSTTSGSPRHAPSAPARRRTRRARISPGCCSSSPTASGSTS